MRFELLPGQRHDTVGVAPLIEGAVFGGLIADKAFDANWIVAAERLKSLAATFGIVPLIRLAEEAMAGAPGDPAVLRRIHRLMEDMA